MSAPVPLLSGCCSPPCPNNPQSAVPGPAGENSFSFTTNNFAQPNVGSNITVSLTHSGWVVPGQTVFVQGGGFYTVLSVSGLAATLTNTGNIGNAVPGTVINVGSQVSPGGVGGNVGNAYTQTSANFNQPAVSSNVTVGVVTSSWAAAGQVVFIPSGGYYTIASIPDGTHLVLTNLGYPGNAGVGSPVNSPQQVTPGGLQGPAGASGSGTLNNLSPTTTKGDLIVDNGANNPLASDVRFATGGGVNNGKLLTVDDGQPSGLVYRAITPNTAATDGDIAVFNGTTGTPLPVKDSKLLITAAGAIQSTPSGGNARGTQAVDLQVQRAVGTQVASGNNSGLLSGLNNLASNTAAVVAGGSGNSASGAQAAVVGGSLNSASGANSNVAGGVNNLASAPNGMVAGGNANTASGSGGSAVAGGDNNTASGADAFIGSGNGNQATAQESAVLIGNSCQATARGSAVLAGINAKAYLWGQVSQNAGVFAALGDCQTSLLKFRQSTTDATVTEMFLDGTSLRAVLPNNNTWSFLGQVLGRTSAGNSGMFGIRGVIKNVAGAVTLSGAAVVDTVIADAGFPAGAAVVVAADGANNSLKITVQGAAVTNIRWAATIRLTEIVF